MSEIKIQNNLKALSDFPVSNQKVPKTDKSFGKSLKDAIGKVNEFQKEADYAIQEMASGKGKNIHQTMISMEKASISFQLMMQVRNKVVAAYEEMMRMQV